MSWQTASFVILALVLVGAFLWYERQRPPARILALVAALAALAVVGRLAFAAFPNVKPVTDIVLFAGYALGGVPGFVVGAITALVSNIFFSQGPWTPWQMVGWGAVGVGGALLARVTRGRELGRIKLALVCGGAAALFGMWMDLYQWTFAAQQNFAAYVTISGTSLPYNVAHVLGSIGFCLLIGPAFVRALRRYRRRFEVRWQPRGAHAGATAALLVIALAVASGASLGESEPAAAAAPASTTPTTPVTTPASTTPVTTPASTTPAATTPTTTTPAATAPTTSAASTKTAATRAVKYLLASQNKDGGFGGAPKQSSNSLHTGWAVLGLAAAGRNARDVKRSGGRSAASYVSRGAKRLSDIGEIERTALVAVAAGFSPRSFGGRDLIKQIRAKQGGDGSISGQVSYTSFGILALKAAGQSPSAASVNWLLGSANQDGGFGVARGLTSDADMTGVALEALAVAGRGSSPAARGAADYLRGAQNDDGGFPQRKGDSSNAQSTAYAIQGLVAVGGASAAVSRGLGYVIGLQGSNGSVAYSSTSSQTPVWVTAQAAMALRKAPLPLAAAPLKPKPKQPSQAASETPSSGVGGGASAPTGGSGAAAAPSPAATSAPASSSPVQDNPAAGGGASAPAPGGQSAPAPAVTTPLSVPTPDADPADAASAQRAAANAGDDGVPPGLVLGIICAALALAALLWFLRRPLLSVARKAGGLVPPKLRRSSQPPA